MADAFSKKEISRILISLDIEKKQSLFILLAADETINRLGNGSINNEDNDMYIGISKEKLFKKLMRNISGDLFQYQGLYDIPDKKGKICELTLMFGGKEDNNTVGFKFIYGSESQRPPPDISEIVINAVTLTDPWYLKQQKMTKKIK